MTVLRTALQEAATKLSGFVPHKVYGQIDHNDCRALSDDLSALVMIFMPVLETLASEIQSETGEDINLTDGLEDDMNDALGALSKRAEELTDQEHEMASRSYQRATFLGVD